MLHDRLQCARQSLLWLSPGDALGSQFFVRANRQHLASRSLPPGPWHWPPMTRSTGMLSSFARRHDFDCGYGSATSQRAGRMLRLFLPHPMLTVGQ